MLYYVLIILAILYVVYIIASSIDEHKYKNNYPKITLTKQQQKIIEKDNQSYMVGITQDFYLDSGEFKFDTKNIQTERRSSGT